MVHWGLKGSKKVLRVYGGPSGIQEVHRLGKNRHKGIYGVQICLSGI